MFSHNTTPNHLRKLITLNNKLLCILQREPTRSHTAELYKTYYTIPVQLLDYFQILTFVYKYVYHRLELPSAFSEYFDLNKSIHQQDTRQKMGKGLLNSKVICYGMICLHTLKQPNQIILV